MAEQTKSLEADIANPGPSHWAGSLSMASLKPWPLVSFQNMFHDITQASRNGAFRDGDFSSLAGFVISVGKDKHIIRLEHPSLGLTWFSLVLLEDSLVGDLKKMEKINSPALWVFSQ